MKAERQSPFPLPDHSRYYVYGRESKADAGIAKVLTMDEARGIASNIAKLPIPLALHRARRAAHPVRCARATCPLVEDVRARVDSSCLCSGLTVIRMERAVSG